MDNNFIVFGKRKKMLRIIFLTNDFLPMVGGVANHVDGLASALANLGHEVLVLHVCYNRNNIISETRNGYQIKRLIAGNNLANRSDFLSKIMRYYLSVTLVSSELKKVIKSFSPNVIHWHDYYHSSLTTKLIPDGNYLLICSNHASRFLEQYNKEVGWEAEAKAKVITDKWTTDFRLLYDNIENNYHHIKSLEKYCPGAEKLDIKYLSMIKNDNVEAKKLIESVQNLEYEGFQFEAADASLFILMNTVKGVVPEYFRFESFRVFSERRNSENVVSEAVCKITVQDNRYVKTGEGVGPVDALSKALKSALENDFERINDVKLIDYKVRIIDSSDGTEAKTRVLIEFTDGSKQWSTIGVHENIINASWNALCDGFNYYFMTS